MTQRVTATALLFVIALCLTFSAVGQTAATWTTQADSLRGRNGERFQFLCPQNGVISTRVWGTDLYTDDSSICSCAVHAGLITTGKGGVVTIQIEPGASSYAGSARNGVTSASYGAYSGSFRFVGRAIEVEQSAQPIDWGTAAQSMRGQNNQVYRYNCPPNGRLAGSIWGTDLYTDDSPICTCAVHAGLITAAQGGEVVIRIKPGASSYAGSTRYGVTSTAYGAYAGSYEFVSQGGRPPIPTPTTKQPPTGTRFRVENLIFNQPDAYQNPRNYHSFTVDFAAASVYEINQEMAAGQEKIDVLVCRPYKRLTVKTTSLRTGYWVEYDWVFQEDGRVAGAWRDPSAFGPSVGAIER